MKNILHIIVLAGLLLGLSPTAFGQTEEKVFFSVLGAFMRPVFHCR